MKKLTDFVIDQEYECADTCIICNAPLFTKIKWIDNSQNYGQCLIYCKECNNENYDFIGWEYSQYQFEFYEKKFHPLLKSSNISICLNCEKIIATVPVILWVNSGRWALYFCLDCVEELKILEKAGGGI